MIADSDPYLREMVGRFVSEEGYSVCFAVDGYEALDEARKSTPVAIIADMLLPRLDGLALCRILKNDPAVNTLTSIIISSVFSSNESATKAGADGFVQKPLEKTRLIKVVEEAISKDREKRHE
jgi:CheY-like chemotaxis protein